MGCTLTRPLCEQWTVVNCTPVWHRRNLHLLSDDEKRLPRIEGNRAISNYIADLKFHRHRSLIQIPWYLFSFNVVQVLIIFFKFWSRVKSLIFFSKKNFCEAAQFQVYQRRHHISHLFDFLVIFYYYFEILLYCLGL
jgi:hypothetical protein